MLGFSKGRKPTRDHLTACLGWQTDFFEDTLHVWQEQRQRKNVGSLGADVGVGCRGSARDLLYWLTWYQWVCGFRIFWLILDRTRTAAS